MSDEGQKITIKTIAASRTDSYRLALQDLHVKAGWNSRDVDFDPADEDDLALAHSIKENSVREPLTVVWEDSKAFITNGHRRFAAAKYAVETLGAEIKSVPVQLEARLSSEADQVLSQVTRNSGKPLKPLELARVYKRLLDHGWKEDEIARRVGRSRHHVSELLLLQSGPAAVTQMVRSGEVSPTIAARTLRAHKGDGTAATETLTRAVRKSREEGATRAMLRHVDGAAADPLRVISDVLKKCAVERKHLDNRVVVTMDVEDWDAITVLLK